MFELSEIFAAGLYAYAVMSDHMHVVLYANPLLPSRWSDEEVAERWVRLVDWTGRQVRDDKRGAIDASSPAALNRLGVQQHHWKAQVLGIESRYWRAVGAVDALIEKVQAIGQRWLKGCSQRREKADTPAF